MNIAITNVSLLKANAQGDSSIRLADRIYRDKEGLAIKGCMTNEAPLKSIMHRLAGESKKLDRILYIESSKVQAKSQIVYNSENIVASTGDLLRRLINNYARENELAVPRFEKGKDVISIEDEPDKAEVAETVFTVYRRLLELYRESEREPGNEGLNVFVESNGGVRYVLTMLLSITRTMENSLDNFHIREISSMVLYKDPVRILETKDIFDTSQITSIIEEYVNYGRVSSME